MGSKWRKVKMLLGLHVCALAPPDPADLSVREIQGGSSIVDSVVASHGPHSTHSAPATPSRSPSRMTLTRHSICLSRSTCSICLETMKPGRGHALFTAECSHTFHFSCIASNVRYGNLVCPVCRAKWREVPWQAPIDGLKGDRSRGASRSRRTSSVLRTSVQIARPDAFHAAEEDQRRLDPVLRILDENIANARGHWQDFPLEPGTYNDDEPLGHLIGNVTGAGDSSTLEGEGTRSAQAEECTDGLGGRHGIDVQGIMLEINSYPEVSAVSASESRENFTMLVHLRAPPTTQVQHGRTSGQESINSYQFLDPSCRAPVDLVTVLDISGSMAGTKLALLKQAMGFVIRNLSHADRLSVVAFSSNAKRIFPLRRMSEEGRQHALRAIDALVSTGGTNIADGLRKGAKVLEDRREHNPVSTIMLLSDGQDTYTMGTRRQIPLLFPRGGTDSRRLVPGSIRHSSRYGHIQIPVHTFGFGADHDAATMHTISEVSGGTFSFIQAEGAVQDAFAQCIGGLLSVVVQDVQLMVSCGTPGVQIKSIQAGSYKSSILGSANHGIVKLGDLYAEEERDVLVEVKLPSVPKVQQGTCMPVLQVGCMYKDPVIQEINHTPAHELCISRPATVHKEQQVVSLEVDRHRNRLRTAEAITEARSMADRGDISIAQSSLQNAKTALQHSPSAQAGDQLCSTLEAELTEIQIRMANRQLYERSGRAYLLSAQSSHLRQRATTRGESVDSHSRDYQTPSMVDMVLRSQTLSSPMLSGTRSFPSHASRINRGSNCNVLVSPPHHTLLRKTSRKVQDSQGTD